MAAYKHERAVGLATVLAIGKANPPTAYHQQRIHKVKSPICFSRLPTLNTRTPSRPNSFEFVIIRVSSRDIAIREVPRLAEKAAIQALEEWGQPRSQITHVVFATTSGVNMPGADLTLTRLLGLNPNINRIMLYQQGCFGGATVLRVAKDLAENNKGARVLTVVSELTSVTFRAPDEEYFDNLVASAIFGDGAACLIIGSDPVPKVERPHFEIHWSGETILPESDGAIDGRLTEGGLIFHLRKDVPKLISRNILPIFNKPVEVAGSPSWNEVFWCVHPGGRAILDEVEKTLNLKPEKLSATRNVLHDFGNINDLVEMRRFFTQY
ncbi:hypothetical protein R1flu_010809 [Riccia fluitans]|uniref:Chalcone synthase n=1 Tax=Riccia fluitans TaxID=41844 RepID=A0ABD1Z950_9MARC